MLHIEQVGSGTRAAILVHSNGMAGRQWMRLATELAATGVRAVVPDLTGHGRSPALVEPAPHHFRDDVAHVVALVAAEPEPVALIGHSYGGLIALQAALAAPAGRVRSIAVYDPVAVGVLEPGRDDDAIAELDAIDLRWGPAAEDRERWLRAFIGYWGGTPGAWEALKEPVRAEFRRTAWAVREGSRTLLLDRTRAAAYAGLPPPLVLTGEHSPLAARRVAEHLGAPRVIAGAGHMGPLTHAAEVNAAILASTS